MRARLLHITSSVIALLAVGTTAGIVLADFIQGEEADPLPSLPLGAPVPLTEDEAERALAIARADPTLAAIAGGREWRLGDAPMGQPGGFSTTGFPLLVGFTAVFGEPFASEGPWRILRCRSTWLVESKSGWENVAHLGIVVDLPGERVIAWGVRTAIDDLDPPRFTDGGVTRDERLYVLPDIENPVVLYVPNQDCPDGLHDD